MINYPHDVHQTSCHLHSSCTVLCADEVPEPLSHRIWLSATGCCGLFRVWSTGPDVRIPVTTACRDIYLHNPSSQSGEYTLFSNRRVYCRFSNGVITTYFSKSAADGLTTEELSHHYNTKSEVDVVAKWSNETQTVSKLAQLSRYSFLPLGITANEHTVYTAPMNLNLQPYLFVGFLPQVLISKSFINGYQANGMDKSFHNCDEGPNSQFTFYANPSNYQPQKRGWETHQVTSEWTSGARMIHSAQGLLPDDYFFDGELHFGGCGAYGITESWSKVHGLSLGVKYVLEHLVVPSC
ncbi:uncharacterized protein LOC124121499 isoform X2 [Haliotis rufescens]|uniref:uncharacterized protein LOC124121499 isoform X2 n=1 Tax=Haliotis rufescens TaxID=6454 RepID=UPI00201FAE94|nr:uncharacterized protein LOC124121499 isoform X2 [Haliotis rufescens]